MSSPSDQEAMLPPSSIATRVSYLAASVVALTTGLNIQDPGSVEGELDVVGKPHQPTLSPRPHEITFQGRAVKLNEHVTIVTGEANDEPTLKLIRDIVSSAGGTTEVSLKARSQGTVILVGTDQENEEAAAAAKALTGQSAEGLDAEGYVLAAGDSERQATVVLNGADVRGTYYAAQSLRQLVGNRHEVSGVQIRDWPLMPVRGSVEGFYGIPWSHQSRLDQFILYGKHKLNTYIYTPKDDELLRFGWRELYEGSHLEQLQELIDGANNNHVEFTFALSPGNDLCYSSDDDFNATVTKFDQIRKLGVRRFYLALDDIPTDKFHCDADTEKWGWTDDNVPLAKAQAYYLNRLQEEFIEANDLDDLETVPTHYAGSKPEPYKETFGTDLNKKVRVHWTGEGVFSPEVTSESVIQAGKTYVTEKLFFWDNFPVNDGAFDRLFLNPLTERDPELYKHLLGFTSNPMQQPYASMLALINYGDYAWNGPEYDAEKSLELAMRELAGKDKHVNEAVVTFVDLNQNWPYRKPEIHAPALSKDMEAFWKSREAKSTGKRCGSRELRKRLNIITDLPKLLPRMVMKGFASDVKPWSDSASFWAHACLELIDMLELLDKNKKAQAKKKYESAMGWVEKTKEETIDTLTREGEPDTYAPKVGDGLFDNFVEEATKLYKADWILVETDTRSRLRKEMKLDDRLG